jgi:hypothetical protein
MKKLIQKLLTSMLLGLTFFSISAKLLEVKAANASESHEHSGPDKQGASCG